MPLDINQIQAPIEQDLEIFEKKFRQSMKTDVMLLDQIMKYIIHRKGKQIRPMFVFLMAGTIGQISEATYRGAALIELLHTATLVHDDVVDDSNYRRGFFQLRHFGKTKLQF
jgi:octaprenyl-diphosphate synthase